MAKVTLLPHQVQALSKTRGLNKVAYYLDMGLGKTFVASEKAIELDSKIILIVCQKTKIEDWKEHYKKFYPTYHIIVYNKPMDSIPSDSVVIINYDLLWRRPILSKLKDFTLILDESSYIKSESSKRTKFIMKMKPKNVILLSGTPTGGKYEELYSQIKLLGWTITKTNYWNTYIDYIMMNVGGFKIKKVTGYKNVRRLKRKLAEHGAIFMKTEDVITLPDTISQTIQVKNIKQYSEFKNNRITTIDGIELVGETTLTTMLYTRQLASMYNKNKYDKVVELLESTEDRIIIFYNFKYECEKLIELCKKLDKPVSIVNGETRDLNNYERLENSVTLIQYQAGSMGLNLQKSNKIIYFSLPLSSDLFEQSKKRTHRLGQVRTCFYYYLITKNSIDEKIFKTLEMRKDFTDKLFLEG